MSILKSKRVVVFIDEVEDGMLDQLVERTRMKPAALFRSLLLTEYQRQFPRPRPRARTLTEDKMEAARERVLNELVYVGHAEPRTIGPYGYSLLVLDKNGRAEPVWEPKGFEVLGDGSAPNASITRRDLDAWVRDNPPTPADIHGMKGQ